MKKKQKKDSSKASILKTFLYFLKVGFVTFGGGYAIIAMLEKELVDKKKWITEDEMMNMIAIGESTPGPIAINLATFIGYKLHKFWGAFFCTLGFVLPSFTIISIISVCMDYVVGVPVIEWFFKGIRAGVVILIGNACLKFFKRMDKNWFTFLLLFTAFFVSFFTSLSAVYLILIGGMLGLIYSFTVAKIREKKEKQHVVNDKSLSLITAENSNGLGNQTDVENVQIGVDNEQGSEKDNNENASNVTEENAINGVCDGQINSEISDKIDSENQSESENTSQKETENIVLSSEQLSEIETKESEKNTQKDFINEQFTGKNDITTEKTDNKGVQK